MNRRLVAIVVLVVAALAGSWLLYRAVRPRPLGETATVRRGTIQANVDALGYVQAPRQIDVSALVSGRVRRMAVSVGEQVVSGTLLLELENPDVEDALLRAERALRLRQMELEEALKAPDQASIDLAVAHLRRATVLRQRAQKDYDEIKDQPNAETSDEALDLEAAKLDYEIAQAEYDRTMRGASDLQLEQLRANLDAAQRDLLRSQEQLRRLRLEAPMDGTVMQINTREGENVYAYNPLVVIADLAQLEIRADINELDIPGVAPGQRATITLDAFPGESFEGQVLSVLPSPSTTRGMTAYVTIITFDAGGLAVRPGMGANVTITTQALEDVLIIPRRAVRSVGPSQVVRLVEGRRTRDLVIVTGLSNANDVQVLAGLQEGQEVLVQ